MEKQFVWIFIKDEFFKEKFSSGYPTFRHLIMMSFSNFWTIHKIDCHLLKWNGFTSTWKRVRNKISKCWRKYFIKNFYLIIYSYSSVCLSEPHSFYEISGAYVLDICVVTSLRNCKKKKIRYTNLLIKNNFPQSMECVTLEWVF